ncbi:probable NADH kinase [Dioscorea cayenensis subsp. rotundata]|uniref:NADH kinase n=1 Tax=Dioscorea cayennensis subsp. rotundata TaxID=55577 RepID=A0AB40CTY7_DIOCR|nr:probable NADH kinase [Dioscorea cayenensis subsp. rotundata]
MLRRVLLLLKPFNVYPPRPKPSGLLHFGPNSKVLSYLDDRCKVHEEAIKFCQNVLRRKSLDWEPVMRNYLTQPIRDVDLVITVGGDGTLLKASHFLDETIPILGVNSDPTRIEEVERFSNEFDATRSTGYLCAATVENFEQVLDEMLESRKEPSKLSRISISLNGSKLSAFALNDILVAHPCPATVSRFSFRIKSNDQNISNLVNCRSSGFRVSTAAGSTAAMLSAGGFPMPILSRDLQYMVREPILPRQIDAPLLHGLVKPNQSIEATWYSKEGTIYIDGSHVFCSMQHGDTIEISSNAPMLKVYLSQNPLTQ